METNEKSRREKRDSSVFIKICIWDTGSRLRTKVAPIENVYEEVSEKGRNPILKRPEESWIVDDCKWTRKYRESLLLDFSP